MLHASLKKARYYASLQCLNRFHCVGRLLAATAAADTATAALQHTQQDDERQNERAHESDCTVAFQIVPTVVIRRSVFCPGGDFFCGFTSSLTIDA